MESWQGRRFGTLLPDHRQYQSVWQRNFGETSAAVFGIAGAPQSLQPLHKLLLAWVTAAFQELTSTLCLGYHGCAFSSALQRYWIHISNTLFLSASEGVHSRAESILSSALQRPQTAHKRATHTTINRCSGDQCQQLLWRLQHGELPSGVGAKVVIVNIGTNDIQESLALVAPPPSMPFLNDGKQVCCCLAACKLYAYL